MNIFFLAASNPDFFTRATFASFAGATSVTYGITNGIRRLTGFKHLAIPFIASLFSACVMVFASEHKETLDYVLIIPNAFLIFSSALGFNENYKGSKKRVNNNRSKVIGGALGANLINSKKKFFGSWLD